MGVVNVTPDSFSDGGAWFDARGGDRPRPRARRRRAPTSLDVGGESTRPGRRAAEPGEELRRVLPVIEALSAAGVVGVGRHDARRGRRRGPRRRRGARQRRQRRAGRPRHGAAGRRARRCRSSPCTGAGHSTRDAEPGASTTTSSARYAPSWPTRRRGARRGRRRARSDIVLDPGLRVRQARPPQLGAAGATSTRSSPWATGARRHVAQDLPRPDRGRPTEPTRARRSSATSPPRRPAWSCAAAGVWGVRVHDVAGDASTPSTCRCPRTVAAHAMTRPHPPARRRGRGLPRRPRRREARRPGVRRRRRASSVDLAAAGASDDLDDTVNYAEVAGDGRGPDRRARRSTSSSGSPS